MSQDHHECPGGKDAVALLAYLESELGPEARRDMEDHLRVCSWCRGELERLQRADALLRRHPEAFHPDAEDLHRFVAMGVDPGEVIANHLAACEACREDASLLQGLLTRGPDAASTPRMPATLKAQVRALSGEAPPGPRHRRAWEWLSNTWSRPSRVPLFALGTAAAMIVVVVLVSPLWRSHWEHAPTHVDLLKESQKDAADRAISEFVPGEAPVAGLKSKAPPRPEGVRMPAAESPKPPAVSLPLPEQSAAVESAPAAPAPALKDEARIRGKIEETADGLKRRAAGESSNRLPMLHQGAALPPEQPLAQQETVRPRVRVVDERGRDIPWLRVDPGTVVGAFGYRETEEPDRDTMDRQARSLRPPAKQETRRERAIRERPLVLVRVLPDGPAFTVEASLVDAEETKPLKTRSKPRVPRENLEATINVLVRSLFTPP